MQTQTLGASGLSVTRLAYGCVPLGGSWDGKPLSAETGKAAFASLDAALQAGLTFFDHADIYCRGKSEQVFGEWLKAHRGLRAKIHVQSKCGIRIPDEPPGAPLRYDFSRAYIVASAEGCLKRLGIEYLDVLLLHRPDALVEPEEVARAFEELHAAGKVRHFGVSNHSAAQMELLRTCVTRPLVANQVEMNLIHTEMFDAGINWNLTGLSASSAGDWTLEYCRRENITLQAWAPLANGLLSGREPRADDARLERIKAAGALVAKLAAEKGVPREAIVLAWLLRHPAGIQPLIGTRQPERIRAAVQADGVELTREEWYALYQAGRGRNLP